MSELHASETLQFNSSCDCKNGANGNSLHDYFALRFILMHKLMSLVFSNLFIILKLYVFYC